jgi:hypothetical protein
MADTYIDPVACDPIKNSLSNSQQTYNSQIEIALGCEQKAIEIIKSKKKIYQSILA